MLAGCVDDEGDAVDVDTTATAMQDGMDMEEVAVANLSPTQGNNVTGMVTFTSLDGAVRVEADVQGLAPGLHGFHVHENGDCSAPDASSAGGHFAPEGSPHGAPSDSARHVGDLGNLEVGQDSMATYTRVDSVIALSGPNSIVGKAVIVHGGEDDLTSQPSGDAGPRLACGVIEMQQGAMNAAMGDTASTY